MNYRRLVFGKRKRGRKDPCLFLCEMAFPSEPPLHSTCPLTQWWLSSRLLPSACEGAAFARSLFDDSPYVAGEKTRSTRAFPASLPQPPFTTRSSPPTHSERTFLGMNPLPQIPLLRSTYASAQRPPEAHNVQLAARVLHQRLGAIATPPDPDLRHFRDTCCLSNSPLNQREDYSIMSPEYSLAEGFSEKSRRPALLIDVSTDTAKYIGSERRTLNLRLLPWRQTKSVC